MPLKGERPTCKMENMPEVVCLGEALIDLIALETDVSLVETTGFKKKAGGSPGNVAAAIARLGGRSAFIGKVGNDPFGIFLQKTYAKAGVDVSRMLFDNTTLTTLAFVSLKKGGIPDFIFYRNPGADTLLSAEDIDKEYIRKARVFHYGSISLASELSRAAALEAVHIARRSGSVISFDPNIRMSVWPSEDAARDTLTQCMKGANIVKLSEEELDFLTKKPDPYEAMNALMEMEESVSLIFVTRGPSGCFYKSKRETGAVSGFQVKAADTTGAGDAFSGAILYQISSRGINVEDLAALDSKAIEEIARYANATGALTTTKYGAIEALPTHQEVMNLQYK